MADHKDEQSTCGMEHYRSYGAERLLSSLDSLTSEIDGVKDQDDIEFVHRMRVASRRLRSALGLFRECFDEDDVKKWNRAVRAVTRDLGEARDLDVQISFLKEFADSHQRLPTLLELKKELEQKRSEAQPRIVQGLEKLERKGTLEEMRRTFKEVRSPSRCSVPYDTMERALHHISVKLDDLLSLQECIHRPDDKEGHHRMRIAAKHLRYTMEAFGKLYDTTFQDRIATVRDLQDRLGELHDCDVWIGMLQARSVNDPGLDALLHDRMEVRIGGYGEVVKTWEKLIDEEFFTDLLGSIVPDVSPGLPQEGGMTKREQLKAVIRGCGVDEEHSLHVAELSLMLFDGLRSLHRLDDEKRDLLEYAGLLHDIGWKEGQRNHHKTSLEMIMTDDGLPFDEKERSIIANVARYHRGVIPNGDHKAYMDLKAGDRRVVDRLAAIIRVADALDVSHTSVVKSAVCQVKKGKVIVLMATTGHPDRELEKAHEKKDLFEKTFKRTLLFEWESS